MKYSMLLISMTIFMSFSCSTHDFKFKVTEGVDSKVLTSQQFKGVSNKTITVTDPNESTATNAVQITFNGYDGLDFLDAAFGGRQKWSTAKTLVFECADGYKPILPAKEFLNGGFYFAYERHQSKEFSLVNNLKDQKKASLAPFYIVWTTKEKQTSEAAYFWPYQLVGISLK